MACEPNETVIKIAELCDIEARLIKNKASYRAIAVIHAERCELMTELLNDHGAKLGLDAPTVSRASEPKHK